jgi:hypothetical protein
MTINDSHPAEQVFGNPQVIQPLSMLDGLLSDLDEHPALNDTVDLPVQARPGWEIRCSTDIPYEMLAAWRKSSADPSLQSGTNEIKLACQILAYSTQALLVDGEPITVDGMPVDFSSDQLQRKLGVDRAVDAVRKLFRRDGFVTAASTTLLREAGYGAEVTPTRR